MAIPLKVSQGRLRRVRGAINRDIQIQWFIRETSDTIFLTLRQRMLIVTELLHSRVVQNISRRVTITTGPRGGRVVSNRSKPGEYPKAETTQLMRTIMSQVVVPRKDVVVGMVGTPLDYGAILERWPKLDRRYLVRTLNENLQPIMRILSGPIK